MDKARPQTILIIGGGLGGLAFAQLLRHSPFASTYDVQIFERDSSPTHRRQGYLIGINEAGMSRLSPIPQISSIFDDIPPKPFALGMVDGDLNVMLKLRHGPGPQGIVGLINRWKLRAALSEGLAVQWGKRFVKYEEFDTHVVAYFDDGSEVRGDLLVGADGAMSKVREQRCPALGPRPLPVLNVAGTVAVTERVKEDIPRILELAEGSFLNRAFAKEGNSLLWMEFEAPGGERRILWNYSFPAATPNHELAKDPVQLKEAMDSQATIFGKELANLIQSTSADDYILEVARPMRATAAMDKNPLGKTTRVTLLGDAAHTMTTQRGLGGNTAFADAADLMRALTQVEAPWQALAEYEENMIKRGFEAIKQSSQGTKMIHFVGVKSVIRNVIFRVLGWVLWAKQLVLG